MAKHKFGTHWYRREVRVASLRVLDMITVFSDGTERLVATLYSVVVPGEGRQLRLFSGNRMSDGPPPVSVSPEDLAWVQSV